MAVDAPGDALLVLLDAWAPDWRATVDGVATPIRHANYLARAVEIPVGSHEVVFRFVPVTFFAGATCSFAAVVSCALLLFSDPLRRQGRS